MQAGIPLVMYMRKGPAEVVELPENTLHAFITWGTVGDPRPCLKVCCCSNCCSPNLQKQCVPLLCLSPTN